MNPYAHANANPLSFTDPLGLFTVSTANQSPNWTPAQRQLYFRYVELLREYGRWLQLVINSSCPLDRQTLQLYYDNWTVMVDPSAVNRFSYPGGFGGITRGNTTTVTPMFFRQQPGYLSAQNPGQYFIFAHEFRHTFAVNQELPSPSIEQLLTGNYDPSRFPSEQDADRFAYEMSLGGCPCGVTRKWWR